MPRAAIVIGVNKTTSLTPLTGAASDALRFGKWLSDQGFEVKPFVDRLDDGGARAVRFSDIFDEVKRIVDARTYGQLVIYFAGHGLQSDNSEMWLLSGAPENGQEAVALEASIWAARESGLGSVVFVSDACRSIPTAMDLNRVRGGAIFPNRNLGRATRPDVDRFFATLPSLVAVAAADANDAARRNGIYTTEFLNAYRDPADKYVAKVSENGTSVEVVTNRSLRKLLEIPVEDAAQTVAPNAGQVPDAIIESDDAYIGRVIRDQAAARPQTFRLPLSPTLSIAEAVREMVAAPEVAIEGITGDGVTSPGLSHESAAIRQSTGLAKAIDELVAAPPTDHFETQTGFTVTGATIADARSLSIPLERFDGQVIKLRPDFVSQAGSVLVQFSDGTGTIVAGLAGYLGHITVADGAVANVNYLPSVNSDRWRNFSYRLLQLQSLRTMAAAATRLGVFRVARDEGGRLADTIRSLKGADPSLGLYAAYAYSSAGLVDQVASVLDYMRGDLGVDLFDVAMLARGVPPSDYAVVPPCPLLRQGWALLEVTQTAISPLMQQARNWLLPGLWTTFAPEGMALLIAAANRGELK